MTMQCQSCEALPAKPTDRLPRGWKRFSDTVYCNKCWRAKYAIRAITIPVVSPLDGTWKEFRETLTQAWSASTSLANWAYTTLYAHDVRRTPEMDKLPPMPKVYLYGMRDQCPFWDAMGSSQAANSVIQQAEQRYRGKISVNGREVNCRYAVIWTGESSLPTARYPQPYPVHNASWGLEFVDNQPVASARIAGKRWRFRLKSGSRYRRQVSGLRHLLDNPDLRGEMSLYRQRTGSGHEAKQPGGIVHYQIMCKMVGWFPIKNGGRDGTLWVKSTPDSLLVAVNAKDQRIWTYNADHVRRIVVQRQRRLQRLADDRKAERRRPKRDGMRLVDRVSEFSRRNNQALTTVCHQVSASLVNYAFRRRFAVLQYDDSDHTFIHEFPWAMLRSMVEQKCRAAGIEFARTPVTKKSSEVLAEE